MIYLRPGYIILNFVNCMRALHYTNVMTSLVFQIAMRSCWL